MMSQPFPVPVPRSARADGRMCQCGAGVVGDPRADQDICADGCCWAPNLASPAACQVYPPDPLFARMLTHLAFRLDPFGPVAWRLLWLANQLRPPVRK